MRAGQLTTRSSHPQEDDASSLIPFLEEVMPEDPFKVEEELGHGFVRLKSTEAEKRQAAQDIRCSEDILIELLRNSRDAGARNIYIATAREADSRLICVIDDGCGIPEDMWDAVFLPRVTSKLDSAHMDKWGMHGRGMALFSTKLNVSSAKVSASAPGLGASISIDAGTNLPEKADQSTFPRFEEHDGIMQMRGPKNLMRTACEFALDCGESVNVYIGSPAQIAATLHQFGMATLPAYERAFNDASTVPVVKRLSVAVSPEAFASISDDLGLPLSSRTARRIMDGKLDGVEDLLTLMQKNSFPSSRKHGKSSSKPIPSGPSKHSLKISDDDKRSFLQGVMRSYHDLADAYYMDPDVDPKMRMSAGSIIIEIPCASKDDLS